MAGTEKRRFRALRIAVSGLVTCLALAGCPGPNRAPVTNTTDPRWVYPRNPEAHVAVVFIHGVFGDTLGTWTADSPEKTSFFSLLRDNSDVGKKVDIFAFGFTSDMFGSGSLNIREAANSLEEKLESNKVWDYDNVVFVAHSMGGLVTMRYLVSNRERLKRTPLIVLYATPMDGADIASIAKNVAQNPALAQMLNAENNEFLATLNEDWVRIPAAQRPIVRCVYETAKTGPVMVVKRRSATRYCEGNLVAIGDSNHLSIVKPDRPTHPSVEMLVNALNRVVLGTPVNPRLGTPDFTVNEAGEWVYILHVASSYNTAKLINNGERALTYYIGRPSDSKLLVLPYPTPRSIPGNHQEDMQLHLTAMGQPLPEYTFTIKADPLGERTVRVKLDNPQALALAQQRNLALVTGGINAFLEENGERLRALPDEAQRQEISNAARNALLSKTPGLSEETQWLLTANALSSTPFNDLTTVALRNVERLSPETARAPALQAVATAVTAQSGIRVFRDSPAPVPLDEESDVPLRREVPATHPGADVIQVQDAAKLETLATQLQQVSSQRQNGLVLQGDLQRENGQLEQAAVTYRNASEIAATPAVRERIRDTQVLRAGNTPR